MICQVDGIKRRKKIIEILSDSKVPISGGALSKLLKVSRQVIVQDIALLRAVNKNIMATPKGYILFHKNADKYYRSYYVKHTNEEMAEELNTMIDNGGKVLDISVEHEVYGQISASLVLATREEVEEFCRRMFAKGTKPLNILADGYHMHTVEAASEVILNNIEKALKEKGYLIS